MGGAVPSVPGGGRGPAAPHGASAAQGPAAAGDVRRVYFCHLVAQAPVRHRQLQPHDGHRLAAILFGPAYAAVLGLIVLVFQAVLLAHGGLTTLGANTFSMAIAGPLVSWGVYALCKKARVNRKLAIFLAASLGDLFTYCVTSLQLAMAYPAAEGGAAASAVRFLGVFAPTQLPLAAIEGILTVLVVMGLESCARPELREIGFLKEGLQ